MSKQIVITDPSLLELLDLYEEIFGGDVEAGTFYPIIILNGMKAYAEEYADQLESIEYQNGQNMLESIKEMMLPLAKKYGLVNSHN